MRLRLILVLLTALGQLSADTIYLKNGRTIVADEAHEAGDRVSYEIGDNSYAIPKSLVDRIEAGPRPAPPPPSSLRLPAPAGSPGQSAAPPADVPAFTPEDKQLSKDPLYPKVVRGGKVDAMGLAALESEGNGVAAAGYFLAGRYEYQNGDREQAAYYLDRAHVLKPDNTVILNYYAAVLVQLGRPGEAIPYADQSTSLAPDSADGYTVLGFAYYAANRTADAVPAWKRSLELHADPMVQKYLDKAQRELAAEAEFSETQSGHFIIRYEGSTTSSVLRDQIQQTLEDAYGKLVSELGIVPRNNISVSLYTQQEFFDVTQAPAWIGAINDGKLRIPIQGLAAMTPALARVLKHELAHSFINQAAHGRCPQWLNEGIAQLVEPKTVAARGSRLAQQYIAGRNIPLKDLETSFMGYSPAEAMLAYDEGLAASEFIRDTYGMAELRNILERIGDGATPEQALQATMRLDYPGFEQELTRYLSAKYSN